MDGFGFPAVAGRFRFHAETRIAQQLIRGLNPAGTVLDLGSGIGFWTEHFAQHFAKVVAVEASTPLYEALVQRCAEYSNVEAVQGDAVSFEPEDSVELVFLGGLLMYLNENDAVSLLRKLVGSLAPCGVIVCRETTVRRADMTRQGDYQAIYRSVASYTRIFNKCGLSVVEAKRNTPLCSDPDGLRIREEMEVGCTGATADDSSRGLCGLLGSANWVSLDHPRSACTRTGLSGVDRNRRQSGRTPRIDPPFARLFVDRPPEQLSHHRYPQPEFRWSLLEATRLAGGWGTMERKRTLRGSGREFDTIAGCL